MAKSMAFMTRGVIKPEHSMSVLKELSGESDRAVAIVGGSYIELSLTDALKVYLHRNKKIANDLFAMSGPLGSFSSKIDLGYLVGIYGSAAHSDFVAVKKIRNAFAHSLEVADFKTEKVKMLAGNLKLCERYTIDQDDHEKIRNRGDLKGKLVRDWPFWIFVKDRKAALNDPRERYVMTMQVLLYGLVLPSKTEMPTPLF